MTPSDLQLESISGEVRLTAEARDEDRQSATTAIKKKELQTREEILMRLAGFFYHPKLLDFDLQTLIGQEQRTTESDTGGADRRTDRQILEYDLRTRFFKDHPYAGEVYSSRKDIETKQSFFGTTEAVITETGVGLHAREWIIPSHLRAYRYEYDGRRLDTYAERRDVVELEGIRLEESADYRYMARYADVDQSSSGQKIRDLDLNATSTHRSGDDGRNLLHNSVRWRTQEGSISTENGGLTSTLRRYWMPNLSSDASVSMNRSRSSGAKTDTSSVSLGLTHQLYESLNTTVSGRAGRSTLDQGRVNTTGAAVALDYRKKTPLGRLGLRHISDGYIQDQGLLQGTVVVMDELHTYVLGMPMRLLNPNVDHASVVVTNSTGLLIYTLGADYTVGRLGNETEILIPITSLIIPGQSLLIDYDYAPIPVQELRTTDQSTTLTYSILDTVDLTMSYSTLNQKVLKGLPSENVQDAVRRFASVRVHPFGASLAAEYEDYDSTIAPFDRMRYTASYQRPFLGTGFWNLSLSNYEMRFKDIVSTERGTSAGFSLGTALGRNASVDLRGEYREIDQRTDAGHGMFFEVSYYRRYNSLSMSVRARYTHEEFDVATDQDLGWLLLTIARSF